LPVRSPGPVYPAQAPQILNRPKIESNQIRVKMVEKKGTGEFVIHSPKVIEMAQRIDLPAWPESAGSG
jgi:hypothetical protein